MLERWFWVLFGCGYLVGNSTLSYVDHWREQNLCTFEEKKHSILNLKRFFSFSLCDWMSVRSDPLFSSHVDFLDLCSLDDLSRLL